MSELSIKGARKVYPGGVEAISGIDLDVADGEFIVLVGPSGCGKSTLLRMIAGLERTSAGEIHIGGRLVNELEPAERDIAMVFQNYALYPHMTVYDNIAYGLRNRRTPRAEIETRVREAARLLAIEDLLGRRPRQLSGGQRQRVAMGRAIVRKPAAFLFDEPLSNLDAKLRVQMRLEIRKLQRQLGTTSIYVTHDQVEAMTMADRLVVMNRGKAEQIGTPREVYARPATTFVASFIGSPAMNFLDGRVTPCGKAVALAGSQVPLPPGEALSPGSSVMVGVRPEDVLVAAGDGDAELEVEMVEHLGSDTYVHGWIGTERSARLAVRCQAATDATAGSRLRIGLRPERLHLFDPASGMRVQADVRPAQPIAAEGAA
jgi:sn-glycerol 3-phosphate transport system ATP-binding protein